MSPVAAVCWVMFMGFVGSAIKDDVGAQAGWLFFAATAPMPLSGWRFFSKEKSNLFDWLGYVAGAGGWLVSMLYGVKPNYGLDPLSASVGALFCLIPAMGLHGLFSIPAFLLDQMPPRPPRRKRRAPRPYSETGAGDLGFDPSRFGNVGGPGMPGSGGGYAGQGPQSRTARKPKWATVLETLLIGYVSDAGAESHDQAETEKRRQEQQEQAARKAREKAERDRRGRESREREKREREARAHAERDRQQQEEIRRLRQRAVEDDYKDALDLFDLKDGYTLAELRKRYRELSQRSHPDKGGTDGLFRKVKEAFELLSKKAK